eukprot:3034863-Pleurochrysis_carterae.AAC.1
MATRARPRAPNQTLLRAPIGTALHTIIELSIQESESGDEASLDTEEEIRADAILSIISAESSRLCEEISENVLWSVHALAELEDFGILERISCAVPRAASGRHDTGHQHGLASVCSACGLRVEGAPLTLLGSVRLTRRLSHGVIQCAHGARSRSSIGGCSRQSLPPARAYCVALSPLTEPHFALCRYGISLNEHNVVTFVENTFCALQPNDIVFAVNGRCINGEKLESNVPAASEVITLDAMRPLCSPHLLYRLQKSRDVVQPPNAPRRLRVEQ